MQREEHAEINTGKEIFPKTSHQNPGAEIHPHTAPTRTGAESGPQQQRLERFAPAPSTKGSSKLDIPDTDSVHMFKFHVAVPNILDLFPHDVSVIYDTSDDVASQNIDLPTETINLPDTHSQQGLVANQPPITAEDDEVSSKLPSATVVNLSDVVLTSAQISFLEKGLKFCPTPGEPDLGQLAKDLRQIPHSS